MHSKLVCFCATYYVQMLTCISGIGHHMHLLVAWTVVSVGLPKQTLMRRPSIQPTPNAVDSPGYVYL